MIPPASQILRQPPAAPVGRPLRAPAAGVAGRVPVHDKQQRCANHRRRRRRGDGQSRSEPRVCTLGRRDRRPCSDRHGLERSQTDRTARNVCVVRGTLSSSSAVTDANGQARVTLTTDRTATVTASAGAKQSTAVTVTRRDPAGVATATLTATPGTPVLGSGQPFAFTATVSVSPDDTAFNRPGLSGRSATAARSPPIARGTTHMYTTVRMRQLP